MRELESLADPSACLDPARSREGANLMGTLTIERVKVGELPESWRARLAAGLDTRVTVRIEEDVPAAEDAAPAFGIWRDRADLADVAAYVRRLRAPCLGPE
jgi:hypothetical protein